MKSKWKMKRRIAITVLVLGMVGTIWTVIEPGAASFLFSQERP